MQEMQTKLTSLLEFFVTNLVEDVCAVHGTEIGAEEPEKVVEIIRDLLKPYDLNKEVVERVKIHLNVKE